VVRVDLPSRGSSLGEWEGSLDDALPRVDFFRVRWLPTSLRCDLDVTPISIRGLLSRFRFSKGTIFLVFIPAILTVGAVFVGIPIVIVLVAYGHIPCFGFYRLDGFPLGIHCLAALPPRELPLGLQGLR
jgi:hypothetical protein